MTDQHEKRGEMPPVNQGRRKLTKAGLALPAVLGTLASRPVLADVPWNCTCSGQASGNASGREEGICTMGRSADYWREQFAGNDTTIADMGVSGIEAIPESSPQS
jgi:hypothetical protein